MKHGFIKVAAAAPEIRVADPMFNADAVIRAMDEHARLGVKVLVFPELTLTGATCGDLFYQNTLLAGAAAALEKVVKASEGKDMLVFVGLPVAQGAKVYDAAAAVCNGELLGVVPASCPGDKHFALPGALLDDIQIGSLGPVDFHPQQLFQHSAVSELNVAVLVGADVSAPVSPAVRHALAGATVLVEMAGFPMATDSACRVTTAARAESAKLHAGVVLAAPGFGESSTDATYSGLCLVAEDGKVLESAEDGCSDVVTELDVQLLIAARRKDATFTGDAASYVVTEWGEGVEETVLTRPFGKYPYRPDDPADYHAAAKRLLHMQAASLVRRMQYANLKHPVVGISGGVDSTLAVMVSAMAVKKLGLPSTNVVACTMPCFGTSSRTKSNAIVVAEQIGAEVRVIDIGKSVYQHFDDIGHAHDDYSIAFENAQARERTQVLMDIANKVNGLDVGTEDLSEFVDGWCTYNGDHTSMYDVNMGLTKTQVRAGVRYIAQHTEDKVLADALWDVLDCPVTPELLPIHDDQIEQKSEENVGSYSLQDFFTHKMMICGFSPAKTMRLAKAAYGDEFTDEELTKWLRSYCKRYFSQQFKRSCLMDGPSVEAFSVSPRTGFLIPSDAENSLFMASLDTVAKE